MTSTRVIFVTYLAVIATGLVLYSAIGLIRGGDQQSATDVAAAFHSALERGDGAAACALLSAAARSSIEKDRKKACETGIVEVREDVAVSGQLQGADVAESSAVVVTSEDEAVFLDHRDEGWRVGATGCSRQAGDAPWDCELEG